MDYWDISIEIYSKQKKMYIYIYIRKRFIFFAERTYFLNVYIYIYV